MDIVLEVYEECVFSYDNQIGFVFEDNQPNKKALKKLDNCLWVYKVKDYKEICAIMKGVNDIVF